MATSGVARYRPEHDVKLLPWFQLCCSFLLRYGLFRIMRLSRARRKTVLSCYGYNSPCLRWTGRGYYIPECISECTIEQIVIVPVLLILEMIVELVRSTSATAYRRASPPRNVSSNRLSVRQHISFCKRSSSCLQQRTVEQAHLGAYRRSSCR